MEVIREPAALRALLAQHRRTGSTIGLVPTMGALHEGHLSLVRECRRLADVVVVSVFVNPLQFGPTEDFNKYPRDLVGDAAKIREAGASMCFAPADTDMYPASRGITVSAGMLAKRWEGEVRPGHFDGVLTVVAKLFGIVAPDLAIFGQKDYQQATLIRAMTDDLNFGVRVEVAPIVRDWDGLALSSRNVYLSTDDRRQASSIPAALARLHNAWRKGETNCSVLLGVAASELECAKVVSRDYLVIVDPATLEPLDYASSGSVVLLAARVGKTRLLDNLVLRPELPVGLQPRVEGAP